MNNWRKIKLGDVTSIQIGGTPSRSNPLFWDQAGDSNNHWVSIGDLKKRIIDETEEQITDLGVRNSNVKLIAAGSVLMSFKLAIGRVAFAGKDLYTNEAIAAFQTNDLDPDFLYYGLQQWNLLAEVDQAIKGVTLNKAKLGQIQAYVPTDKFEQSAIVRVLATLDRAIEQTEALVAKERRIKTGLMQDLLARGIDEHGQLRDPATHRFKDSPLGRVPVEWEVVQLGAVSRKITSGSRGWAAYYSNKGAKFIRIGNLTREHVNLRLDDIQYVQPPITSEGKRTALEAGDLLISITADLGIIGIVPDAFGEAYVNQHIALIKLKREAIFPHWIGNFLAGQTAQMYITQLNESGAKAGLNLPTVSALPIAVPTWTEQKKIASILQDTDKLLSQEIRHLAKLRRLKTGLMQDLLTGRVSVAPLLEGEL